MTGRAGCGYKSLIQPSWISGHVPVGMLLVITCIPLVTKHSGHHYRQEILEHGAFCFGYSIESILAIMTRALSRHVVC